MTAEAEARHVLIVQDGTYRAECPHAESHPTCAWWEPCGCEPPRAAPAEGEDPEDADVAEDAYERTPCPLNPGLSHFYDGEFVGAMSAPTGGCWVAEYAPDLDGSELGWPGDGRYWFTWHNEDNALVVTDLAPLPPVDRDSAGSTDRGDGQEAAPPAGEK